MLTRWGGSSSEAGDLNSRIFILPLLLICLGLTACGSSPTARIDHGVIKIRSGTAPSSLQRSVLNLSVGTEAAIVRATLGMPFAMVRSKGDTCWAYRAEQPGTSLDALDFCINEKQRVDRILIGVHL